jgi:hypothetical protein
MLFGGRGLRGGKKTKKRTTKYPKNLATTGKKIPVERTTAGNPNKIETRVRVPVSHPAPDEPPTA